MCGRYHLSATALAQIQNTDALTLNAELTFDINEVWNSSEISSRDICPSDFAPVLLYQNNKFIVRMMQWGFPNPQGRNLIINARAETVTDKRMFGSIFSRRCVIPAEKYYEWDADRNKAIFSYRHNPQWCQSQESNKDKSPDTYKKTLYLAGFYDLHDGIDRFVILTTDANESVRCVHDRMPLILEEEEVERWLSDNTYWRELLKKVPPELERFQEYEQQCFIW